MSFVTWDQAFTRRQVQKEKWKKKNANNQEEKIDSYDRIHLKLLFCMKPGLQNHPDSSCSVLEQNPSANMQSSYNIEMDSIMQM